MEVYGDYWILLAGRAGRYSDPDDNDYTGFLAKYDKTYMGERARTDWLKLLGRKGEWDQFESERRGRRRSVIERRRAWPTASATSGGTALPICLPISAFVPHQQQY